MSVFNIVINVAGVTDSCMRASSGAGTMYITRSRQLHADKPISIPRLKLRTLQVKKYNK